MRKYKFKFWILFLQMIQTQVTDLNKIILKNALYLLLLLSPILGACL